MADPDRDAADRNHASHGVTELLPKGAVPLMQAAQCLFCGARNRQLRDRPCPDTPPGWPA